MEIPAFYAVYRGKGLYVTDGRFTATSVRSGTRDLGFLKTVSEGLGRDRRPVMIIDCNSFEEGGFSEKVMKHMAIKGADQWLLTCINTVDDVFDAFNKDAEFVFAPYHMILDDDELRDICDVSDSVIPTVFVHNGKAVLPRRRTGDVLKVLEKLVSIGYYKNCVLDMEGSLDGYTWSIIREDYPSTIPMVDRSEPLEGFQATVIPQLL